MNPNRLTSILQEPHFSFRVRSEAERILATLPGVEDPAPSRSAPAATASRPPSTIPLQQEAKRLVAKWVETLARLQREQLGHGRHRLGDRRDRRVRRQRGLLQPRGPPRPGPVRRGRARQAPARIGLQADHVRLRLPVPRRDRVDDARRRHDRVRARPAETSYRPTNADIKERGPVLAMDALRYSLNIPSVQMQYLVGSQTTANFAQSLGIASADYIMAEDPGPLPGARIGAGEPDEHDAGVLHVRRAGRAEPGHHDPRDPRPRQPRRLHPRGQRPRGHEPDDRGRGVPAALHPRGQHGSGAQHPVGRARPARHSRRPAATGRLQDRHDQRLPRRLRASATSRAA